MPEPSAENSPSPQPHDLVADRRRKLQRLREQMGIDPYGHRIDGLVSLADARARYDQDADAAHRADASDDRRPRVRVAGRVMQHRAMGNLVFLSLRDASGDLQVAVSKKSVDPQAFKLAKLTDLSDIVAAEGPLAKTKTGEITVWAQSEPRGESGEVVKSRSGEAADGDTAPHRHIATSTLFGFTIASKSLAPPPGKWHGLQDAELRYRKRYVDLYANPDVMRTMQLRIRIIDEIRRYLRERGFIEVETPMLQTMHGGAAARPFETHHNALDLPLSLRIAPELHLKRLLVGGMPRIFEINRNFRNEGVSPRHNPEFTMLEAYEAFGNWETMAELVEDMICTVAQNVLGTLVIEHGSEASHGHAGLPRKIDLTRPWRRVSMVDLVEEKTGWRFDKRPLQDVKPELIEPLRGKRGGDKTVDVAAEPTGHIESLSPAEQLVEVYEKLIEPTLIDPCFVTRVPSVVIPLAKPCADDPFFADVYELAINGVEISPGYTEQNDPDVQERQLRRQVGDEAERQQVDEDFLEALRVGMPPAGGMGLGIDRLVMMLLGAPSIRDVILFPLMRPKG